MYKFGWHFFMHTCSRNTSIALKHAILPSDAEEIRFRSTHTCSRNTSVLSISLKSTEAARSMPVDMGVVTCTRVREIRHFCLRVQFLIPKTSRKNKQNRWKSTCFITFLALQQKRHRQTLFAWGCSGGRFVAHVFEKCAFSPKCPQQGGSGNRGWQSIIVEKSVVSERFTSTTPPSATATQVWVENH